MYTRPRVDNYFAVELQKPFRLIPAGTGLVLPWYHRSSSLPFWWCWTVGVCSDGQGLRGVEQGTAKSILKEWRIYRGKVTRFLDESLVYLWVIKHSSPQFCFIQISLTSDPSCYRSPLNVLSFPRSSIPLIRARSRIVSLVQVYRAEPSLWLSQCCLGEMLAIRWTGRCRIGIQRPRSYALWP